MMHFGIFAIVYCKKMFYIPTHWFPDVLWPHHIVTYLHSIDEKRVEEGFFFDLHFLSFSHSDVVFDISLHIKDRLSTI